MSTEKTAKSTPTALTTVLLTPLPWSSLQRDPLIGGGGYGDVYQAAREGKTVAVKQLNLIKWMSK